MMNPIDTTLQKLRLPPCKGEPILYRMTELTLEDESLLHQRMIEGLYGVIAKERRETVGSVMRNVRTAIQLSWDRGGVQQLAQCAGRECIKKPYPRELVQLIILAIAREKETIPPDWP